jgi:hypothetical protein
MTRDKQLAIGALALVLFGGLAVKQMRDDAKLGSKAAQEASLPKIESADGAEKLTVTNGEKGEFVLEKKGETWELVKPLAAKANGQNVKLALDNLKELKIREQISSNPDADLLKSYELDAAKGVHVVVEKGDKVVVDATFGKSGGRGQLMTVAGTTGVFAATGFSSFLFARDAKGWRDIEIAKFEEAKATGLHYVLGDRKLDFALEGAAWAGTENGKAIDRFDPEKVKDAVRSLQTLNADDFADGKSDGEVGLDKPAGSLTVDLNEGSPITLTIGGETPSKGRWVKRAGAAVAMALPSYAVDWLVPDTSKFQKAAAAAK